MQASKSECMLADTKIEKKELEARAAKLKGNKAAVKAELAHEKQAHQEVQITRGTFVELQRR